MQILEWGPGGGRPELGADGEGVIGPSDYLKII